MQRIQGVVVGDYGVGKTSLLYAMVGKPVPQDHVPTLMESHMVVVEVGDGKKIEFVVWDTPGSDDHQQLTEMGLAKKDIVVLCFSLVDDKSYQRVKSKVSSISVYNETSLHSSFHTTSLISLLPCLSHFFLASLPSTFSSPLTHSTVHPLGVSSSFQWLPLVKKHLPTAPIVLVGTKLDQRNTPAVIEDLLGKGIAAVDSEQGEEMKENIGALIYIECSARNKESTDRTLKEVAKLVYEQKKGKNSKKCAVM